MAIFETVAAALGPTVGKLLLKNYLGDTAAELGKPLLDIAKTKITDGLEQRRAENIVNEIADEVIDELRAYFEGERVREIRVAAISEEVGKTLTHQDVLPLLLRHDIDSEKTLRTMRNARPLPADALEGAEHQYYDTALRATVEMLARIIHRLPGFEPQRTAESLGRLRRLEDGMGEIRQDTRAILRQVEEFREEQVRARLSVEDRKERYEQRYLEAVANRLDYVELFGADIKPETREQSLSIAYIPLTVEADASGDSEPIQFEELLSRAVIDRRPLLVLGEAGSGKSTLFRWAALTAARSSGSQSKQPFGGQRPMLELSLRSFRAAARSEESMSMDQLTEYIRRFQKTAKALAGRLDIYEFRDFVESAKKLGEFWNQSVPFLLRLRDCQDGRLPAPEEWPGIVASEVGAQPEEWVQTVLETKRGLILLDGIDEVPDVTRVEARRAIEALLKTHAGNVFLISSRPPAIDEGWFTDLELEQVRINPMSDPDRELFIERWHRALAANRRRGVMAESAVDFATLLKDKLRDAPPIRRLASNPLLCAAICALHYYRNRYLPDDEVQLCEALCQLLIHRREEESGLDLQGFPEPYRALGYAQKRRIIQAIAHYMVRNGESAILRDKMEEEAGKTLSNMPNARVSSDDVPLVCKGLIERSGVLRAHGQNTVDFIHNTLKEFLAGEWFAIEDDAGLLADKALDPAWQPVVIFAAATNRAPFASRLVEKILDSARKRPAEEVRTLQVLALRCRAVALELEASIRQRLDQIERTTFPPQSMADAEGLAALGDEVVRFLRHRHMNARHAAACVRALRLIGTPAAQEALQAYTRDRRKLVANELAQALNPLEIEYWREIVVGGDKLSRDIARQVTYLSPLAGLTGLQVLDLFQTQVSDVSPLAALTDLQILSLALTQVSDVSPLAGLTGLQEIYLYGTQMSDVSPLAHLVGLHTLSLDATQVSDVSPLAGLINLQLLTLIGSQVSDVSPLAHLIGLRTLSLDATQVSDVSPLAGLTNLKVLTLAGTQVSDVSPLADLIGLRTLTLDGTPVSDVSPLAGLTGLQRLNLYGTQVSDVSSLAGLKHVRILR